MANAFRFRSECPDVPSVDAIEGVLVFGCDVEPPPPPIYEFPLFEFPLPTPPGFDFGCYSPSVSVNFEEAGSSIDSSTSAIVITTSPKFEVKVIYPNKEDTGQCQPTFLFNVRFPGAIATCPEITTEAEVTLNREFEGAEVSLTAERDEEAADECKFNFDFSLNLPCASIEPMVSVSLIAASLNPSASFTVSLLSSESGQADVCRYEFNLDLFLPKRPEAIASTIPLEACSFPLGQFEPTLGSDCLMGLPAGSSGGIEVDVCFGPNDPSCINEVFAGSGSAAVEGICPTAVATRLANKTRFYYELPTWVDDVVPGGGGIPIVSDVRLCVTDNGGEIRHTLSTFKYTLKLPEIILEEKDAGSITLEELEDACEDDNCRGPSVLTAMNAIPQDCGMRAEFEYKEIFIEFPTVKQIDVDNCFQNQTAHCAEFCAVTDIIFTKAAIASVARPLCKTFEYRLEVTKESVQMPHVEILKNGAAPPAEPPEAPEVMVDCDGGTFTIIDDVKLVIAAPGADGACPRATAYQLDFTFRKVVMECDGGGISGSLSGSFEPSLIASSGEAIECCADIPIVQSLDSFTLIQGNPPILELKYTNNVLKLPEVVQGSSSAEFTPVECALGTWDFNAITSVTVDSVDSCDPCGKRLNILSKDFGLIWPEPGANEIPIGPPDLLACCDGAGAGVRTFVNVLDADTIVLENNADGCGYHLAFDPVTIILPTLSLDTMQAFQDIDCAAGGWAIQAVTGLILQPATEPPPCVTTCAQELVVQDFTYKLLWPAPSTRTFKFNTEPLGLTDCCETIDVLINDDASAFKPDLEVGDGGCGYRLRFETKKLRLPVLQQGDTALPSNEFIECVSGKWSFTALSAVSVITIDSAPCSPALACDKQIDLQPTEYELVWPDPTADVVVADLNPLGKDDCCEITDVVVSGITLQTGDSNCGYKLAYSTKRLRLPNLQRGLDPLPTSANISCSGGEWVVPVVTDITINSVDSPECSPQICNDKELRLNKQTVKLQWPTPTAASITNNNDLIGLTDCCETVDVLTGSAGLSLALGDDDCGYKLVYETQKLRLPNLQRGLDPAPSGSTVIACVDGEWSVPVLGSLVIDSIDSPDCSPQICNDKEIRVNKELLKLQWPAPGAETITSNTSPAACCTALDVVVSSAAANTLKLELDPSGCGYKLAYSTQRIVIPTIIGGADSLTNETAVCVANDWEIEALTSVTLTPDLACQPCGVQLDTQKTTWKIPIKAAAFIEDAVGTATTVACGEEFDVLDPTFFQVVVEDCIIKYKVRKKTIKIDCSGSSGSGGGGSCEGGISAGVSVVCGLKCEAGNFIVCIKELTFTSGCLTGVGACEVDSSGGECP